MIEEISIAVPDPLRAWIVGITLSWLDVERGAQTVMEEPDPAAALAIRSSGSGHHDLFVFGPRTRALYTTGEPGPSCVKLRIQPGRARLLLGQAISDLVDRAVPLADVWGEDAARLVPTLAELGSDPAGLSLDPLVEPFQLVLDRRLRRGGGADRSSRHLVEQAALMLSPGADGGPRRATAVARRLGISDRQLRNLFADAVGVSPKRFAQIERVRAVLERARDDGLAAVAAEIGYFDQAHMTAQFRRLMGVPPRAFFAGQVPASATCPNAPATLPEPPYDTTTAAGRKDRPPASPAARLCRAPIQRAVDGRRQPSRAVGGRVRARLWRRRDQGPAEGQDRRRSPKRPGTS